MRDRFPGYYRPTESEFGQLWQDAIISPDTNVLLNTYRYSESTREQVFKTFSELISQVWVPYEVAFEYHRNRLQRPTNKLEDIDNEIGNLKSTQNSIEQLVGGDKHPYIEEQQVAKQAIEKLEELIDALEEQRPFYENIVKGDRKADDPVRDAWIKILNNRTAARVDDDRLDERMDEGEEILEKRHEGRLKQSFPLPSGKDEDDKAIRRHQLADFLIWKELVNKAIAEDTGLIFVTNDRDWMETVNGNIVGPHPGIVQKFNELTGHRLYTYPLDKFLKEAEPYIEEEVEPETIDEVQEKRAAEESRSHPEAIGSLRGLSEDEVGEIREEIHERVRVIRDRKRMLKEKLDRIPPPGDESEFEQKVMERISELDNEENRLLRRIDMMEMRLYDSRQEDS